MSDAIIGVLVGGLMSGLFGLATLWINQRHNERLQSKQMEERATERRDEYQEWYRRTLFEKRLAAVQQAYSWWSRLNAGIASADPDNPNSETNKALLQISREARQWYDNNTVYLYDEFPRSSPFIGLMNTAGLYASGHRDSNVSRILTEAAEEIKGRAKKLFEVERRQCNE